MIQSPRQTAFSLEGKLCWNRLDVTVQFGRMCCRMMPAPRCNQAIIQEEQSIVLTGSLSVLSDSEQYIIVDRQKLLGAIGNDFRVNDSFILLGWIYFHGWASL